MMRLALASFFSTLAVAAAQTPPLPGLNSQVSETSVPPALAAAKARLSESLTVADRTVTSQWLVTLTELEKKRAEKGDYEGAMRARQRREQALIAAGSDDGRIPVLLTVSAPSTRATKVTLDSQTGTAVFGSSGAFITWEVTGDFKGWYEVMLTHGVAGGKDHTAAITPVTGNIPAGWRKRRDEDDYAPQAGGWACFQSLSSLGGSSVVLRREIVSTGGWSTWRTVSLGRVQIQQTRPTFRLGGEEVARQGLMHFRQLELVPVSAPSATSAAGELKLKQLRDVFESEYRKRALTSAASGQYRAALLALEQQAKAAKDNDLMYKVRDEIKHLTQRADWLALSSDAKIAAEPTETVLTITDSFKYLMRGETAMDSSRKYLTKLRPAGAASVTWRLPDFSIGSGEYEVFIKCRVPVKGGGTATLTPLGSGDALAGKPLNVEVKPVAKPEYGYAPVPEERTEEPGKIVIEKNAEKLTLAVTSLAHGAEGYLVDLYSVTLNRIGDVPPEKGKETKAP